MLTFLKHFKVLEKFGVVRKQHTSCAIYVLFRLQAWKTKLWSSMVTPKANSDNQTLHQQDCWDSDVRQGICSPDLFKINKIPAGRRTQNKCGFFGFFYLGVSRTISTPSSFLQCKLSFQQLSSLLSTARSTEGVGVS